MAARLTRFRGFYGAKPLHLLTLVAAFALAAHAALNAIADGLWRVVLAWFLGAVVGHDLVLFPLYAVADRSLGAALRAVRPRAATTELLVSR